jgi:hypothetical protein
MLTVYHFRSDSGSSEDETLVRRKLGPALSVPTYPTYTQILSPRYRLLLPFTPPTPRSSPPGTGYAS